MNVTLMARASRLRSEGNSDRAQPVILVRAKDDTGTVFYLLTFSRYFLRTRYAKRS
jgi:hypothetical protein